MAEPNSPSGKVTYWLDFAHEAARKANGNPKRLFQILERDLGAETWWECWIPLVVSVACLDLVDHEPLAAMELLRQFGHDTDSYLQLLGAFVGALHGAGVFPVDQVEVVGGSSEGGAWGLCGGMEG